MSIEKALKAIDEAVNKSLGVTTEGAGLFYLLDSLAVSTLGVPRTTMPVDAPTEPVKTDPQSIADEPTKQQGSSTGAVNSAEEETT